MRSAIRLAGSVALVVVAVLSSAAFSAEVGEAAPEFTLDGSDGHAHKLAEYRGRHVVLAFFPKAFTGG